MKFEAYSYNPFSGGGSGGGGTPLENKTIELPYINNSLLTISTGQLIRSNGIVNNDGEIVIDGTETNLSSIIGFSKTAVTPTSKGHIITTGIVEKIHSYDEGELAYLNISTGVVSDVAGDESTIIGIFLSDNRFYLQGISLNNTAGKLPTGGLTNDILIKKSGTNYDTEWASELDTLNLDTDYVPTGAEPIGSSFYDSTNRCISTVLPNSILQNGKELYTTILNQTGSTILDGQVVYINGAVGMSDVLTGAKFIANGTINDMKVAGIATQDIANGAKGEITHFGTVRGLNTTGTPYGEVWNEGDTLYASATVAGGLTNIQPQAPNLSIKIGYVINKHANVGSIFVQPTLKSKLTDLYDVNGTPLDTTGQIMIWDNVRKVFDFTDNIEEFRTHSEKSGTTININNAENNTYFNNILIDGKTSQKTYDGIQLIPYTLSSLKAGNTSGTWSGNTYTANGITCIVSVDEDNNVTNINLNGTASGNFTLMLKAPSDGKTIATGVSHTLTGAPTGCSTTTYSLRLQNYENSAGTVWKSNQDDIGSGKVFTTTYQYFNTYIRVNSGINIPNKTFNPMLTLTSVRPHNYEPYVGGVASPNELFPQNIVGIDTINLTVGIDELGTDDDVIIINLPEIMYETDYVGKYTKNICIEKGIAYNEIYEGVWGYLKILTL